MVLLYWGTVLFQVTLGGVYLRRWLKFGRRADLFVSLLVFLSFLFLLLMGALGGFRSSTSR